MKLRPEFKSIRAQAINNNVVDIDEILGDLIRTETRLTTQAKLDRNPLHDNSDGANVFAAGRGRPHFTTGRSPNYGRLQAANTGDIKCRHCEEIGHVQAHCKKRNICVYCKRNGHIISECRTLQNKSSSGSRPMGTSSFLVAGNESSSTSEVGNSPSPATLDTLVQEALNRVLPSAIQAAFSTVGLTGKSHLWHLDSASFNHMTGNPTLFQTYNLVRDMFVEVANGHKLKVAGIGHAHTPNVDLPNTLYVPSLVPNLISIGQLVDNGCQVTFSPSGCIIQDMRTQRQIGRGSKNGRNFYIEELRVGKPGAFISTLESSGIENKIISLDLCNRQRLASHLDFCHGTNSYSVHNNTRLWNLWHSRLGHPHAARLRTMFQHSLLPVSLNTRNLPPDIVCEHCIEAKSVKKYFSSSTTVIDEPFSLVHTDLWGPAPVTSRLGYKYFALFIDHATRYIWIYFLRHKSDLLQVAQEFVRMVQTQFNRPVKVIRSDPGGEFSSHALKKFYTDNGMLYQQSCPGVSEQNGLVERKHRHVLDLARALLLESHVPSSFWVEVVHTVVYLINRQISTVLQNRTPYELLMGTKPSYSMLRVFGCLCFVLLPQSERTKLMAKTARCVFIGYSDNHKGYMCYDPQLRRIRIAYHVVFLEHIYYYNLPIASESTTYELVNVSL
ncbi:Retrovirus-related Pol polyprotein from transposon RE1 [Linum perenne]